MSLDTAKIMQIAHMLGQGAPVHEITRSVRCSGRDVGVVKRLITRGLIGYDENGRVKLNAPPDEIEHHVRMIKTATKKGREIPESPTTAASDAVKATLADAVAEEASKRTSQYLEIGKIVASAYWKWAQAQGIPIEEAVKHDIGKIVSEALDKSIMYDKLVKRLQRLEEEVAFYRARLDPILRLERGCELLVKFLEFAVLADALGIDVTETDIAKYYTSLIEDFLTGRGMTMHDGGEETPSTPQQPPQPEKPSAVATLISSLKGTKMDPLQAILVMAELRRLEREEQLWYWQQQRMLNQHNTNSSSMQEQLKSVVEEVVSPLREQLELLMKEREEEKRKREFEALMESRLSPVAQQLEAISERIKNLETQLEEEEDEESPLKEELSSLRAQLQAIQASLTKPKKSLEEEIAEAAGEAIREIAVKAVKDAFKGGKTVVKTSKGGKIDWGETLKTVIDLAERYIEAYSKPAPPKKEVKPIEETPTKPLIQEVPETPPSKPSKKKAKKKKAKKKTTEKKVEQPAEEQPSG